jgi:ubiquinone/menaquinone biosynthesis C-methylase UbiE
MSSVASETSATNARNNTGESTSAKIGNSISNGVLRILGSSWTEPMRRALRTYVFVRSGIFALESWMAPLIEVALHRTRPRLPTDDKFQFQVIRKSLEDLLNRDVDNIIEGQYPVEVLIPENPIKHLLRMPELLSEGIKISRRRSNHNSQTFAPEAAALLEELPDYYRRNFHFQDSGYLSAKSARLYEHQVDILFAGSSDAMRRMIIAPLRRRFNTSDGEGLTFLELGAGTGRATRFVRLAFPKAKIVALDLSAAYLKRAQEELMPFRRHDFMEGDAAHLSFRNTHFDAVYSVFLFHELPMKTRSEVLAEAMRVLRPGGIFAFVDSLQLGDNPELEVPLREFPKQFHEPFYKNYIETPMEQLMEKAGLQAIETATGFFSKVASGTK